MFCPPSRVPCLFLLALCFSLASLFPGMPEAAEHQVIPAIKARTTYDDNVFFDDVSDLELRAMPRLTYRIVHETGQLEASAQAEINRYLDETQYDRVNHSYNLGLDHELTPRLSAGMQARFAVDHTFETELEEFGLETNKQRRNVYSASPNVTWELDPRHTLRLDLRWKGVDNRQSDPDDRDYDSFGLSLSLFRQWTERFFWVGQLSADLTDLDDRVFTVRTADGDALDAGRFDERQYSFQALAGFNYNLSENLKTSFRVGGGRAEFDFEQRDPQLVGSEVVGVTTRDVENDEWLYLFQARLDWQQEFMRVGLVGQRDIIPKFDGDNVDRTLFRANVDYELGARFILQARGSFVHSKSVGDDDDTPGGEVDSRSYAFSPGLRYMLSPEASLTCRYEYRGIDNDAKDESKDRQRVWVEFSYRWPMVF